MRRASAAGPVLLAAGLPLWARGGQPPTEAPPEYLELSSALIGADAAQLEPAARNGEFPLADTFHALCLEAAPEATAALLDAWREAAPRGGSADDPAWAAAAGRLLAGGERPRTDGVGALARLTMLMWLYGVWYGGTEMDKMPDSAAAIGEVHRIDLAVSAHAYGNGWIWRMAQARPMGTAGAPGDWGDAPPDLDDFLG